MNKDNGHEGHDHGPTRVVINDKEFQSYLDGLTPELATFSTTLKEKFPNLRLTSGKRDAGQKIGANFKNSKHNLGEAIDIAAENKGVFDYLTRDPEGMKLLVNAGLGILDETNPKAMKKTKATGAHFHIGKDSALVAQARANYQKYAEDPATFLSENTTRTRAFEEIRPSDINMIAVNNQKLGRDPMGLTREDAAQPEAIETQEEGKSKEDLKQELLEAQEAKHQEAVNIFQTAYSRLEQQNQNLQEIAVQRDQPSEDRSAMYRMQTINPEDIALAPLESVHIFDTGEQQTET